MDGWLRNSNGNSKRGRKLILLPISSYLGNIYRCCSSVLKANTLVDFNAVVAAFYSTCTRGKRKSPGLYVLKLKMHIFPLVWKQRRSCQIILISQKQSNSTRIAEFLVIQIQARQLSSLTSLSRFIDSNSIKCFGSFMPNLCIPSIKLYVLKKFF